MNIALVIVGIGTFLVATLTFLASITDLFKRSIPIKYGFLLDGALTADISLSTGDPAKPITLRFHNSAQTTLTGIVLDVRFLRPLTLSGTQTALTFIPGKTTHGKTPDESFYLIRYSELEMAGQDNFDFRVELGTKGKSPGTYKVLVTAYSTQQDYKCKKAKLQIKMT